jgi:opacity protein-like surface antigen
MSDLTKTQVCSLEQQNTSQEIRMRNKAIFLATTAVALVLMGTPAKADGLYISAFGGLNVQPGSSGSQTGGSETTVFSEDADTGFVVGGAIGTELQRWVQGLRAEMEVSYRRNDRSGSHEYFYGTFDDPAAGPIDGNLSNFSVLANLWYEFDIGSKFRPYVGGGAGWALSRLEAATPIATDPDNVTLFYGWDSTDEEANGIAFQLGAGINHNVAPGVDVGIGYRYFNGPNFDPIFVGKNNLPVGFENENHSVLVNVTISTN